jgi:predicted SnoaL-like aldol condensation-catalyzing enzyme
METSNADQIARNKRVVREFYEMAFNQKQPEDAVARYMGSRYVQHNPQAGDGPEPFIGYVRYFTGTYPNARLDIKRVIAEGDLVVVHGHMVREVGDRGMAVMDIFRVEDGKVVEHWDVIQDVPERAENANTMF